MPKTRYDSHTVNAEGAGRIEAIRMKAEELAKLIDQIQAPPSRASSLAQTHLETAVMFATRAVSQAFYI
ncbi:MAG: Acb2/Tad1 domain-containing protein [Thermoplasmatota archaeon]